MSKTSQKGFSAVIALAVVVVIASLAFGGWYVWQKNRKKDDGSKAGDQTSQTKDKESGEQKPIDETANWATVTTQGKAFTMRIPDGWKIVSYPGDFLGSMSTAHKPGEPASVETSGSEYVGHSLRFRASVVPLDDAGLEPQWASPQPNLTEFTQDVTVGSLHGKRFKGVFSGDLNQTLYEYVFELGDNKKLDIVYTVYHQAGEKDEVDTAEKAIQTIKFN